VTEPAPDRRKSQRFPVRAPVQLTAGGEVLPAILKDLCRDAALVEVRRPLPLGTEVSLLLKLPGTGGPLQVGGHVVRVAPGPEPDTLEVAVLFVDMTAAAETRIDFFIALQTG
jgi:PilZ domain